MNSDTEKDLKQLLAYTSYQKIYVITGKTELRKGIDGLATFVKEEFDLDPFNNALFLFCGTKMDRFKALVWESDGFLLFYKRLENGPLLWPRKDSAAKLITQTQLKRFLQGFPLSPSVQPATIGAWY